MRTRAATQRAMGRRRRKVSEARRAEKFPSSSWGVTEVEGAISLGFCMMSREG